MSPVISERSFEDAIECALLQHDPDACAGDATTVRETSPSFGDAPPGGYRRRRPEEYDRALCLLPRDVLDFVLATQPKEWKKLGACSTASSRPRCASSSRRSASWRTSTPHQLDDAQHEALLAAAEDSLEAYMTRGGSVEFTMPAHIVTAAVV